MRCTAVLAAALLTAGSALAQEARTIAPGMSEEEVRAVFGTPQSRSSYGPATFYFYNNSCERECGFPDLVIFRDGRVADAVLRAPWHRYSGESSSPKGVLPRPTPGGERLQMPTAVEGVEVRPADLPPPPRPVVEKPDTTVVRPPLR